MQFGNILNLKGRVILYLAKHGALTEGLPLSTVKLAEELKISQQSASRILIELEKEGFLERKGVGRFRKIRLTEKALKELLEVHIQLKDIFEKESEVKLEGVVFTGLGEGAYYTQLPHYVNEFKRKLGFKPYPGTLNLRLVKKEDILKRMLLEKAADVVIEGFSNGVRAYGGAKCIRGLLDGEEVFIIFIERTHYSKNVIEIVAPVCLREKFNLKDGDKVTLKVKISPINLSSKI